ncbi:nitrite/sulfite reductase [Leptotrichia buccalis]|uniref:Nitrite and sulphite reductase 4Fe-4S region n=1 Tax=Leptotrichia buccalis (strain ATCC 14201 / DSM 1135 / JCM 12969 / NCTC 10249 / C-1013-b) TaxID=523794 RepID=C7NE94_LEPBD|nr:nitrite/sulfite reductase [Leptotrichia buccalis]ACV38289.1 nitrite and sulphite reductase 4Fe-4S region [Leptotrichia buccalis C-1013-b]
MKLDNFKRIEDYEAEREKKELEFIINLTREALTDPEKEKEWNAVRTSFALYTEGRKKGTYMIRPRFFESKIDIEDFEYLLDVVQKYCDKRLHLTTRQDFQLHGIEKENLPELLEAISKRGFFTKATCGDSTRAVITPETTGFEEEVFDVSPHAKIVTDYILNGREFMHLPRKYKIAFSNKEENSLYAKINDIGFQAVIQDGKKGFRVYVGGGIGPISTNAIILREFIEEDEFLYYIHAIRNVFNDHGNRKIRARARLRYVLLNLGEEKFLELCNEYISNFYVEKGDSLRVYTRKLLDEREILDKEKELEKIEVFSNGENTDESIKDDEFIKSERNIVAGKHKGEYGYYLRPARGNIYKEDGEKLIKFVKSLDYKVELKLTSFQSILVRGLKKEDLLKLREIMEEYYGENEFFNSYSCIGSTTCNVGILDTPPILDYIFKYFENDEKRELTNYLPQIKIAGCPNSCATPQIAKLGFSGRRKKDGEYFAIFARGEFTGKTVKLNEIVGEIKASKIPYFLEDIANIIKEENIEFEEFVHEERFIELIEKYKEFELEVVDFNDFRKADMERAW